MSLTRAMPELIPGPFVQAVPDFSACWHSAIGFNGFDHFIKSYLQFITNEPPMACTVEAIVNRKSPVFVE